MLRKLILAPLASLALLAGPVAAQQKPAPASPAATAPTKQDMENAVKYLQVMIAGLQSDKVEQPIKSALIGCIYGNSLRSISTSMDKVIADNADKISRDNADQVLSAMAAVCGYRPAQSAAPAPSTSKQPQGR
jgi:hypothetical protein